MSNVIGVRRLIVLSVLAASLGGAGYALAPAHASPVCAGGSADAEGHTASPPTGCVPTPYGVYCAAPAGGLSPQVTFNAYVCIPAVAAAP